MSRGLSDQVKKAMTMECLTSLHLGPLRHRQQTIDCSSASPLVGGVRGGEEGADQGFTMPHQSRRDVRSDKTGRFGQNLSASFKKEEWIYVLVLLGT